MHLASLNDAYEIDSKIPERLEIQARYDRLSKQAVLNNPKAKLDVAYGSHARQRLDILPPSRAGAAAILFFHGGYWTAGSKESRRFPAAAWNSREVAWVSVEYRRSPDVTIEDIVVDARTAVAWFNAHATRYGCDPDRIHVCGNSAGGHIAGTLAAAGWQRALGLPDDVIKSATALSGLFDLRPLVHTFVNGWLELDDERARRSSPIFMPLPRVGLPVILSWGGRESDAFRDQSRDYESACSAAGAEVTVVERPDANHLSIIGELAEPSSPLFSAIETRIIAAAARTVR